FAAHLPLPCSSIFFLMLLCPPRSTLFPYTTLFRSPIDTYGVNVFVTCDGPNNCRVTLYKHSPAGSGSSPAPPDTNPPTSTVTVRSEEHTSELQSRENLVCRLLLEKKKKK